MTTLQEQPAIELSYRHDLPTLTGAKRANRHLVASYETSDYVLRHILDTLELTPAKLARLIGQGVNNSYRWFSAAHSPSHAYWVRIAHVQALALSGINLNRVRTIDWSQHPYRIEWWPGAEPQENQEGDDVPNVRAKSNHAVRKSWGDIPKAES